MLCNATIGRAAEVLLSHRTTEKEWQMKRFIGCALTALFVVALAGTSLCRAGENYVLKLGTSLAETSPIPQGLIELGKIVKEKSGGRLTIEFFPSGQLGWDEDVIEQMIMGANVGQLSEAARLGFYVPNLGIVGMAYFVADYDEFLKVTETATFKGWEKELAENGIRVLSFNWYDGPRHFLTHTPINKPEDLNSMRIRTPGAPAWSESVKALGATPVAMNWPDTYNAIQTKVIDGCEAQDTATLGSRLFEVVKYRSETGHFQLINNVIVGEKWFQTLPADLQELLVTETKKMGEKNARWVERLIKEEVVAKLTQNGMITVQPDRAAFVKASDAAYKTLGFTELRKQIYKEIGKE